MKLFALLAAVAIAPVIAGPISTDSQVLDARAGAKAHVDVALGNQKRNVGELKGPALYNAVFKALEKLCPADGEGCVDSSKSYDIDVERYNGHTLLRFQRLRVSIKRGYWGKNKPLRKLMIGTIASAAQKASEDAKNCYNWVETAYLTGGKSGRHCNMGDFIGVKAGLNGENFIEARFGKDLETGKGSKFDCVAVVQKTSRAVQDLMPEYKKALGGVSVDKRVHCLKKQVTRAEDE